MFFMADAVMFLCHAAVPRLPLQCTVEVDVQPEADALWMPIVVALVGDVDDIAHVMTWERRVANKGKRNNQKTNVGKSRNRTLTRMWWGDARPWTI